MKKQLGIAFLVIGLLTGCGTGGKQEAEPQPPVVRLTVWGPQEAQTWLTDRSSVFMDEHPEADLTVAIESEAVNTVRDTVLADVATAADVFLISQADAEVLKEAQALLPWQDGSYYRSMKESFGTETGLVIAVNAETAETEWAMKLAEAFEN